MWKYLNIMNIWSITASLSKENKLMLLKLNYNFYPVFFVIFFVHFNIILEIISKIHFIQMEYKGFTSIPSLTFCCLSVAQGMDMTHLESTMSTFLRLASCMNTSLITKSIILQTLKKISAMKHCLGMRTFVNLNG